MVNTVTVSPRRHQVPGRRRGDRMARVISGRRSHKQDQLNSNGIPRFLDFFRAEPEVRIPLPPAGSRERT
jgi:hypothetical protein